MGLFNTYKFSNPLYCPYCGDKHEDIQSGLINSGSMAYYKIGDIVGNENDNIIREEEYYCNSKDDEHEYYSKCEFIRSRLLRLGHIETEAYSTKEKYEKPFTYPHYFYIVLKNGEFLGVVASRQDAELLGNFDDDSDYYFDCG